MKKTISIAAAAILFTFITVACSAQEAQEETAFQNPTPNWVSTKGYWVIKSNIKTPTEQTVYYYNNNNELVHQQTISGTALNLNRRKVKMQLKKTLETSLTAWAKKENNTKEKFASQP